MHALIFKVSIKDREKAEAFLKERVVPAVSQAPGFVAGYWTNVGGDRGMSMVVFESEEAAKKMADDPVRPPEEIVVIESVEVAEVVAHA